MKSIMSISHNIEYRIDLIYENIANILDTKSYYSSNIIKEEYNLYHEYGIDHDYVIYLLEYKLYNDLVLYISSVISLFEQRITIMEVNVKQSNTIFLIKIVFKYSNEIFTIVHPINILP